MKRISRTEVSRYRKQIVGKIDEPLIARFLEHIVDRAPVPSVILDVGSWHAEQSIEFSTAFPEAKVYAFECNPPSVRLCRTKRTRQIAVVRGAVCDKDGPVDFYPIDMDKHPDCQEGAAGMFETSEAWPEYSKHYIGAHRHIKVPGIRLDTWAASAGVNHVDLIWMDLQGAELLALQGMGELLNTVQAIWTEVAYRELFAGGVLFRELDKFLWLNGFACVAEYGEMVHNGNACYVRKALL